MKLNFAFAVSKDGLMKDRHFGDADKFLIFEEAANGLEFHSDLNNIHKDMPHGEKNKAEVIAEMLAQKNVQVVVSRQFGKNLSRINHFFIPVIVHQEEPEKAAGILQKHLYWFRDAWEHKKKEGYKKFCIENGILKVPVKQN